MVYIIDDNRGPPTVSEAEGGIKQGIVRKTGTVRTGRVPILRKTFSLGVDCCADNIGYAGYDIDALDRDTRQNCVRRRRTIGT